MKPGRKATPRDGWDGPAVDRLAKRNDVKILEIAQATEVVERQVHRYLSDEVFPPYSWRRNLKAFLEQRGVKVKRSIIGLEGGR